MKLVKLGSENMSKIKIVTDSTVDLSDEILNKYGIEVVPLSITLDGRTYIDRVELAPAEFIEKMRQTEELPKSSQPAPGVFIDTYNRLHQEGYEILSIHMSGNMSGTVRSAENAAELTDAKVTVIDSRFISKALSFQVVEAAVMAQQGKSMDEILERISEVRLRTKLFVVVDTLENLVKGGRIGKGRALIGSLLNIKPIASLEGGEYTPVHKARSYSQVVKYLSNEFVKDVSGKTIKAVGITHAEGLDLANKLIKSIHDLTGFASVDVAYTTPIISTHTGIGAIGFAYYAE